MLTALDDPAGGFRDVPAGEWSSETGRRQRLTGMCDPGGECRDLFGVGEGPAKAAAEAKQETTSDGNSDERQDSRLDVFRKALPVFYQESQVGV